MTSFRDALLVSLPAWELSNVSLGSSVFGREALIGAALSSRLRAALSLIEDRRNSDAPLLFVAHPEIFTDGVTMEWLRARVGAIADHLAISDGSSIRLLPGFSNHVFFYGLGWPQDGAGLARLERRVPEIFTQLDSQVNSALQFQGKHSVFAPNTAFLKRQAAPGGTEFELRRLFLNRHTVDGSASRMLDAKPVDPANLRFGKLTYIRLSERGLLDTSLTRQISTEVVGRFVDPTWGVIFVLPQSRSAASPLLGRLHALARGLIEGGCRTPMTPASNMFVATENLPESTLLKISDVRQLIVDEGDDFWGSAAPFYDIFEPVTVFAQRKRHQPATYRRLLRRAYGPAAVVAWTSIYSGPSP